MNVERAEKARSKPAGPLPILAALIRLPGGRALSHTLGFIALLLVATAFTPGIARAEFGIHDFDVTFTEDGTSQFLAGSHPEEMKVSFKANLEEVGEKELPVEPIKDIEIFQIPGFVGDQTAVPVCPTLDFLTPNDAAARACANATAVGLIRTELSEGEGVAPILSPVYNLAPTPGSVARLGFFASSVPVTISIHIEPEYPNRLLASTRGISQVLEFFSAELTLWGVPADPAHDEARGECYRGGEKCPAGIVPRPFLTLPRACEGPLRTEYEVDSWAEEGVWVTGFAETHDEAVPPNPQGMIGCGSLGFDADTAADPSTASAESASGLDFTIDVEDEGLKSPAGRAKADIEAIKLELPAGVTTNPSAAEGLGVCSETQFQSASVQGPGCPGASKLGSMEAETPLLENHPLRGSIYLAEQYDNPFGSLLALYLVIRDEQLGIVVRQAIEVRTDPTTGRLVTMAEELPPFPLSHVGVHLRSGPRSPLITPPDCGTYEVVATLYPSSSKTPLRDTSSFTIDSGPGGGPCPSGGLPFAPGFEAGAANNAAGSYSPFAMRLTRHDGDQDIARFDATLPPGVLARLAGVERCPDAAIAVAKGKTGREELASPSCPAGSRVGAVRAGAGVGTALTYVPGSVYMAGPVGSAPLSVVAIVPAVAGPFDVGTVVVRQALALDPITSQVRVDSANSDPIPHILEGIPLKVRDIRVNVDRPGFTLNPTSCRAMSTTAAIWGGGTNFLSASDDAPVGRASRFQAASCASLAFKPKLAIKLFGGVKRGDFPALRAIVTPPPGQANFARAAVTLPRTAFLEQGHIRTICTRVQFAAGAGHGSQCPAGAIYGHARAWSPLLDAPAEGPVFLRSSSNKLPDLVVALKGPASAPVDVELSSRIDSVKIGRDGAGIRSIFTGIPDVPVSRFVLAMQGGQKGLIVNSDHLCRKPARNRARANLLGQNGRRYTVKPVVRAVKCKKKRRKKAKRSSHRRARAARASAVR